MTHRKFSARILSLVLTVAMVGSMMPSTVFATEGNGALGASSTEKITRTITAFDELEGYTKSVPFDGHTYALNVKLNMPFEDVKLPTKLSATVERTTTTTPPTKDDVVDSGKAPTNTAPDAEEKPAPEDKPDAEAPPANEPKQDKPEQDKETTVTETTTENISVSWQGDRAYTPAENSKVIYTPVLPEGYALAEGAKLPQIYVFVGRQARAATAVTRTTTLDFATTSESSYIDTNGVEKKVVLREASVTDSGEGWAWDVTTGKLTLSGANIRATVNSGITDSYGILKTIYLAKGTVNTVTGADYGIDQTVTFEPLTITGDGELRVTGSGTAGIFLNPYYSRSSVGATATATGSEKLNISGNATVIVTGGSGTQGSYGIIVRNSSISISGNAAVTATGVESSTGENIGIQATDKIMIDGGTVSASGKTAAFKSVNDTITAEGATVTGASETFESGTTKVLTQSDTNPVVISITKSISFDARNGAAIADAEITGSTVTMPANPTWSDYTFAGWYTGIDGTGTQFVNSGLSASATVYAKWTKGGKTVRTTLLILDTTDQSNADQGWSWDANGNTLTLNGFHGHTFTETENPSGQGMLFSRGATVVITGKNSIIASETGMLVPGLAIQGSGSLDVEGRSYGIKVSNGTLTIDSGTINAKGNRGIYANGQISIKGDTVSVAGVNQAIWSSMGTITATGATVTGATEEFLSGTTKELNQSDSQVPVVFNFGPSISVAAQNGTAAYGTAASPTFAVTSSSFGGTYPAFAPRVAWTNGSAPAGVTTAISGGTLTIKTTAATPAGEHKFKVVSAKTGGGNYESAEVTLKVGKLTATIIWGSTTSFPYTGRVQAPTATVGNKVGSDAVTVTVTGGETNVGSYTAMADALAGAAAGNYVMPSVKPTLAFTITKAAYAGTQAAKPDASKATKTDTSITLATQTISGETVEYGYSTTAGGTLTWRDSTAFTGLSANTEYYFFARVKANSNHDAGVTSAGTAIKTDLNDTQKVAAAKKAVDDALKALTATNATDAGAIIALANKAITDAGITGVTPSWDVAFNKSEATEEAAGSMTGKIKLTCGVESAISELNKPIAKLPSDPAEKIRMVKAAIEAALNAYKPTNTTTAADIKKIADNANTATGIKGVTVAWKTPSDFSNKNSTNTENGKVTGTFDLSCTTSSGSATGTVAVNRPIERTDEQKLADAQTKVLTALAEMKATNATTDADVLAVVNKALSDAGLTGVTASWKAAPDGFDKTLATESAIGSITGGITLKLNSTEAAVDANLPIARLTADKTALNQAIAKANEAKNKVTVNNNTADKVPKGTKFVTANEMKALTDEIAKAQTVATNPNANAPEVAAAQTALERAIAALEAAVKTGTSTGSSHKPVSNITGVPTAATAGTDLTLSGTITPADATNKTIVWSVKNAGTTGATMESGKLKTTAAGTVIVTATIANGVAANKNYTQEFTIRVLAASAGVSGTVTDEDGNPVDGATVKLVQGGDETHTTTTQPDGSYSFATVPNGIYKVVVTTKTTRPVTVTETIIVAGDMITKRITVPGDNKNTLVVSTPGTPKIAVGGLNDLLDTVNIGTTLTGTEQLAVAGGGSVDLKFVADKKTDTQVSADKGKIEAIAKGKKLELLIDLSVLKTVKDASGTAITPGEAISSLAALIEVQLPIPASIQGKAGLSVYRVHSGSAEALPQDTANADGEYYTLSDDGTYVTLYLKNFSTYAIGVDKTNENPDDGGGSGSTGGSGGSSTGGSGSGSSSDKEEYDFWMSVKEEIQSAQKKDVIKVNARGYDRMPWSVMDALRENDGVGLIITWLGNTITIPAGKALPNDSGRIYWSLSKLAELFAGITEDTVLNTIRGFNPETGGGELITLEAPPIAENAQAMASASQKTITPPDAGFEKDAFVGTPDEIAVRGINPAAVAVSIMLLAILGGGGVWFWKRRKTN